MANKVSQQLMFHAGCNPQQQELPRCSHNNVLTEPQPLSAVRPHPALTFYSSSHYDGLLICCPLGCHTVSKSQQQATFHGVMKRYILVNILEFLYLLDFPLSNCQSPLLSVCECMFVGSCQHSSHGTVITCNMLLSASVSAAGRRCPNCAVCSSGTSLHCKLSFILTPLVICNNNDEHDINAVMHVPSG